MAVLEDYADDLTARFARGALQPARSTRWRRCS
jgi:hypothetical protein